MSVGQWLRDTGGSVIGSIGAIIAGREAGKVQAKIETAKAQTAQQAEVTKQKMYIALGATAISLLGILIILKKR